MAKTLPQAEFTSAEDVEFLWGPRKIVDFVGAQKQLDELNIACIAKEEESAE